MSDPPDLSALDLAVVRLAAAEASDRAFLAWCGAPQAACIREGREQVRLFMEAVQFIFMGQAERRHVERVERQANRINMDVALEHTLKVRWLTETGGIRPTFYVPGDGG